MVSVVESGYGWIIISEDGHTWSFTLNGDEEHLHAPVVTEEKVVFKNMILSYNYHGVYAVHIK